MEDKLKADLRSEIKHYGEFHEPLDLAEIDGWNDAIERAIYLIDNPKKEPIVITSFEGGSAPHITRIKE